MTDPIPAELLNELTTLRSHIQVLMNEVAAVRHPLATEDRLQTAADELTAIVSATENATNDILGTAEEIGDIAAELAKMKSDGPVVEKAARLEALVGDLFAECGFQDITGQRVAKVISVLEFVENRITSMIEAFGPPFRDIKPPESGAADEEAKLLNGPQDASRAVSQSDIDNMFG